MHRSDERGIALITTMLVLMMISALLVGFTAVIVSDQRHRFLDRDRGQSFYAAAGAIEKLTSDLGNLFFANIAPTAAQVTLLTSAAYKPVISGVDYVSGSDAKGLPASQLSSYHCAASGKAVKIVGGKGYTIMFCANAAGNPTVADDQMTIRTGPFEGLIAQQIPYQLDATAKSATGGEVHLIRTVEGVAIPVFQFGMFSDVDLSFSAADDFTFGGRVHTNGNLYLSEANGSTLTLTDKITAVKEVVRQRLSNGVSIDTVNHNTGNIKIHSSGTTFRLLTRTEGSVTGGPLGALNGGWYSISTSQYNYWIRNTLTGAKPLNLPLITVGGSNPDLVRRPAATELSSSILFNERLFTKASLRILLSDTAGDITGLPSVTAGTVNLNTNWNVVANRPAGYTIDSAHPPVALSPGSITATVSSTTFTDPTWIVNFADAASAAPFKPKFTVGTAVAVSCTDKGTSTTAPFRLTGCTGLTVNAGTVPVTANSPAGGDSGATIAATSTTTALINFATAADRDRFHPAPFWKGNTLVSCTGFTATSYTGCSSNPSAGVVTSAAFSDAGTGLLGGHIKIERGNTDGSWTDVTAEILSYGIGGPNFDGTVCADPTPNAIVRMQRLRDNGYAASGCTYNTVATGVKDPANWWPNVLFDAREAVQRDSNYPGSASLTLGGTIYYVAIDAANLAKYFKAAVAPYNAGSGAGAKTDNGGYTLYFSDRRNNRNAAGQETGEYGWEDFVNPSITNGVPNATLDCGEDVNVPSAIPGAATVVDACGRAVPAAYVAVLDTYGGVPNYLGTSNAAPACTVGCAGNPLTSAARPTSTINRAVAQVNRAILFRRALKLVHGSAIAPTITGLTVVSENPVYIQGDWNATPTTFGVNDTHAATAVIADAVTVLSDSWRDDNSLEFPYAAASRPRDADSYYRVAIISGKGLIFDKPGDVAASSTFGTDGGAHSFLRMLEGGGSTTVHYRGSMATFFYNRQAVGAFKCCGNIVYSVPTRDFYFDSDFLDPAKLPPNTPVFRDMNAVGFSQELRPGR